MSAACCTRHARDSPAETCNCCVAYRSYLATNASYSVQFSTAKDMAGYNAWIYPPRLVPQAPQLKPMKRAHGVKGRKAGPAGAGAARAAGPDQPMWQGSHGMLLCRGLLGRVGAGGPHMREAPPGFDSVGVMVSVSAWAPSGGSGKVGLASFLILQAFSFSARLAVCPLDNVHVIQP